MADEVSYEHKTIMDGRYHAVTSLDESGVHAAAESESEARRKATAVYALIQEERAKDAAHA